MAKPIFTMIAPGDGPCPIEDFLDELYFLCKRRQKVIKPGRNGTILIGHATEPGKAMAQAEVRLVAPDGVEWQKVEWEESTGRTQ